jgi:osmotically-inducible protein OsmY
MSPLQEELQKQNVVDQLTWDSSVNSNEVHVEAVDGRIRLEGKVPNYTAKLAAERDAYNVIGVTEVENFLEVEFPPAVTIPPDREIESNIKRMILLNARIASGDISVTVKDGVVTLSGVVETIWEKYEAEDVANSAAGVVDVQNNLEVILKEDIIDADIANDILATFQRSSLIDENRLAVEVNNGVVRLTGEAPTFAAKREAYNKALFTQNVRDVIDDIVIV